MIQTRKLYLTVEEIFASTSSNNVFSHLAYDLVYFQMVSKITNWESFKIWAYI